MDILIYLFKYNGPLLIFSATGFLLSLIWYTFSERKRRVHMQIKEQVEDEKSFFEQFDDIENPSLRIPDFSLKNGPKSQPTKTSKIQPIHSESPQPSKSEALKQEQAQKEQSIDEKKNKTFAKPESTRKENKIQQTKSQSLFTEQEIEESLTEVLNQQARKSTPSTDGSTNLKQESASYKNLEEKSTYNQKSSPTNKSQESKEDVGSFEATDTYDEDEKKVKDLLEQIKKDMHEQGG